MCVGVKSFPLPLILTQTGLKWFLLISNEKSKRSIACFLNQTCACIFSSKSVKKICICRGFFRKLSNI